MYGTRGVLQQLDAEWGSIAESHRGRRTLRRWALVDERFEEFESLRRLVEHINRRGDTEQSDAFLLALLRLAGDDELAARTVLQAMMPAIKRMTATFSTCGAWPAEESANVVLVAM